MELGKHYIWYMGASESGGEVYARSTKIVSVASSNRFSTPLDEHEQIENKKEPWKRQGFEIAIIMNWSQILGITTSR